MERADKDYRQQIFISRKTVFYDNFVSFWTRHSKHSCQLGCLIPNIHITLDHFPMTLDISCHFGQCHKRSCFLLVFRNITSFNTYVLKQTGNKCFGNIRVIRKVPLSLRGTFSSTLPLSAQLELYRKVPAVLKLLPNCPFDVEMIPKYACKIWHKPYATPI